MKRFFPIVVTAILLIPHGAILASEAPAQGADAPLSNAYLFDLFKSPDYRAAWKAMFAGETAVPSWIDPSGDRFDGVATPSQDVEIGGKPYLLSNGCEPHDCGDNQLYVVYSPDMKQSWGLLDVASEPPRFFGNPGDAEKQVLMQAAE